MTEKEHPSNSWPEGFFDFPPLEDIPDFKAFRKDLKELDLEEDPLA